MTLRIGFVDPIIGDPALSGLARVVLPDGKRAWEYQFTYIGGSETHLAYEYRTIHLRRLIEKDGYETDYWGKIEGLR